MQSDNLENSIPIDKSKSSSKDDFWVECNVCKTQLKNWIGSTPCCGSIAWLVVDGEATNKISLYGSVNGDDIKPTTIDLGEQKIKKDGNIILAAVKGGRCFNGSHRDRGQVVHAVPTKDGKEPNGYWGDNALCGAKTGARSYGWSQTNKQINCPKCLKKLSS